MKKIIEKIISISRCGIMVAWTKVVVAVRINGFSPILGDN